jgi:hypothetical protein
MWNVEKWGFPWRELIEESLKLADEVVIAVPLHIKDPTYDLLKEWNTKEPKLSVVGVGAVTGSLEISDRTNDAIDRCTSDLVVYVQADEILEMDSLLKMTIESVEDVLMREPRVIGFPRLDFCCSASHVTPIFESEPPVKRLFAKKWFPQVGSQGDAMHIDGRVAEFKGHDLQRSIFRQCPIFHYHGLSTEAGWQEKETRFQELYHDQGLQVDERLKKGWGAWDDKCARRYSLARPHPEVMKSWLSKAEMHLRDPFAPPRG